MDIRIQPKVDCFAHHLVANQFLSRPDFPAVDAWDGELSYSELDILSDALAKKLTLLGVGSGCIIPILFEKSKLSIIAMMAVIRAGAAFLPLDHRLPLNRLRELVIEVGASLAISSISNQGKLSPVVKELVMDNRMLHRLQSSNGSTPSRLSAPISPDDALYIIFTSGSTGKPKGVVISHAAFCSSAAGFKDATRLNSASRRSLHYASPGFDASIIETLVTLTVGGCICIPSEAQRWNDLAGCIREFNVNWTLLTPSVARLLCPEEVPQLRVLCLGGESLPREMVDVWANHVELINAYGPTEASIIAIVSDPIPAGTKAISLGKARNCAVWIVTPDGKTVQPFGAIGEIVIEGPGVAEGYYNDPAKSSLVFADHMKFLTPITKSVSRFYKTGDLGRMLADGTVEYMGREDGQIKLNGQRIELGEIEHHFKENLSNPQIYDAIVEPVTVRDGGNAMLVALVGPKDTSTRSSIATKSLILDEGSDIFHEVLKATENTSWKLAKQLPGHMIPKLVLPCAVIPISTSGKTDRKRLRTEAVAHLRQRAAFEDDETNIPSSRSSEQSGSGLHTPSTAPGQSPINQSPKCSTFLLEPMASMGPSAGFESLQKIWSEILMIPRESINLQDDFFKLGGDSIGLIRVVGACRRVGVQITVAEISNHLKFQDMLRVMNSQNDQCILENSQTVKVPELIDSASECNLREEAAEQCGLKPNLVEEIYPCTHMQETLMVANILHPGASVGRFVFRLAGEIDIDKFKRAWERVWSTCPILRTRAIYSKTNGALQAVTRSPLIWRYANSLAQFVELDDKETMMPGAAMTRMSIIQEPEAMYFAWTMHHMLYDAWTIPLLCKRVNTCYRDNSLEDRGDYKPFVSYTKTLDMEAHETYWKTLFRDLTTTTFPAGNMSKSTYLAKSTWSGTLDLTRLRPQHHKLDVTFPHIIQAAWAIMISRMASTSDVLFGATVSGRNAPVVDIDRIDGPTLSSVPVRFRVESRVQVVDFLHNIRDHFAQLIPYEQTGLNTIKNMNEDTKRGCAFRNLLLVQSDSEWDTGVGPLQQPEQQGEAVPVPLLCQAWIHRDRVIFDAAFDDSITSLGEVKSSIEMVMEIVSQILVSANSPGTTIGELYLLIDNNTPSCTLSPNSELTASSITIQESIYTVMKAQRETLSLCSTALSITYGRLDTLSTNLAVYLLSFGIGRGSIVPLHLEKSIWTVVAMIATLKAGAAFVLLDPTQPREKLEVILDQIDAKLMLTSDAQRLSLDSSLQKMIVSDSALSRLPSGRESQLPIVSPDDLAYMIFTSGSTGQPKGVMISHAAIIASATAYGESLQLRPNTRVLQFSSYSFDACINETLVMLLLGATICVPSEEERVQSLTSFMRRFEIQWAILTPSVARLLLPEDVPGLETLDLGGEAPDEALLAKWHHAGIRVFNVYGPAEGAGTVACQEYSDGLDPRTIGRPMGCRLWIVDKDDHDILLPDGQVGELLIEGPTLADGYFKDHSKTSQSFIDTPVWAESPVRLYKTGDICYKDKTQAYVYVGRKDFQIKINGKYFAQKNSLNPEYVLTILIGQRIELGEIESHIARCSSVKGCVVLYPGVGHLKKQLTAIVALDEPINEFISKVKKALRGKVSDAMVPTNWVEVSKLIPGANDLPLSASGKVDRHHLSTLIDNLGEEGLNILIKKPSSERPITTRGVRISVSEERAFKIAQKVQSMLNPDFKLCRASTEDTQSLVEDSFDDFYLESVGLDSLNMMSLMYFISREFGVSISLQTLMQGNITARGLAAMISQNKVGDSMQTNIERNDNTIQHSVSIQEEIERHDNWLRSCRPVRRRRVVLLTGANGYVGTEILRQLLENEQVCRVIGIVRGENKSIARNRTLAAANAAQWWTDLHEEKLEVWPGDLSKGRLGLSMAHWQQLEDGFIDVIIHNGAAVHWTKSYRALEAVNVGSTTDLLALAAAHSHMRMTYVTGGRGFSSSEETELDIAKELSASDAVGYCQTKFVAEALVRRAGQRYKDGRFSIVTPGLVVGTPERGIANRDDYLWRLTAACIRVGAYNGSQASSWLQVSDVATLAATIIGPSLGSDKLRSEENLFINATDGMTWGQFWDIIRGLGYNLEARTSTDWLELIRRDIDQEQEQHPLWPLAQLLESHLMEEESVQMRRQNICPPLKLRLAIRRSAEVLAGIGFLPRLAGDSVGLVRDSTAAFSRSN